MWYILDKNNKPIESNVTIYNDWIENNPKRKVVRQEYFGDIYVSTVFLSLDHSFFDSGKPLLWETMIFGGEYDQYQMRYSSYEEALKNHKRMVKKVMLEQPKINFFSRILNKMVLLNLKHLWKLMVLCQVDLYYVQKMV